MKIGIDCRLAGVEHAGIGRYIEELVRRITKDPSIQWVLFFHHVNQLPGLENSEHVKIVIAPVRHYSIAEQVRMPGIFSKEKLDLLHVPHFNIPLLYQGNIVVTIHDLIWHAQKGSAGTTLSPLAYSVKYRAYTYITKQAVMRAKAIIVPTQTIKESIQHHFPEKSKWHIYVTHEGVGEKFQRSSFRSQSKIQVQKILFYTGSLYPHKNVMLVVRALSHLPGYQLCISSSRTVFLDRFFAEVKSLGLQTQVQYLGKLSDDELVSWYQKSLALVQPSLSEGFGLTGIEALASGVPVIASNIPIFKEIYHDAFIAFDPHSVESLVGAVRKLAQSNRAKLIEKGRSVASRYSFDRMADQTLNVYQTLL